jgi:hypothetical protein
VYQVWRKNNPCALDTVLSRFKRYQPVDCWAASQHTRVCANTNQPDSTLSSRSQSTVASISSDAIPKHASEPPPGRKGRPWSFESRHQTSPIQRRPASTYYPPRHASTLWCCPCRHAGWPRYTVPVRAGVSPSSNVCSSSCNNHAAAAPPREPPGTSWSGQPRRSYGSSTETRHGLPATSHVSRPHHA